jgi:hypothetical protein
MKSIFLSIFLITIACRDQPVQNTIITRTIPQSPVVKQEEKKPESESYEFKSERFDDARRIGRRKLNRVEINSCEKDDKIFVKINFYAKDKLRWALKNEFEFEKRGDLPIEPQLKDFNGDGFNDVTFVANIAARGANQVRELLIFDSRKDELTHIKNSQEYPNLKYNPLLKCIDSMIFTGSTETAFLKIKDDKLVKFASVNDSGTERTVTVIDRNGIKKVIRREKQKDDGLYRYINYNPVMKYK